MQQLPELSQLSHAQKDELIHVLRAMVQVRTAKVEAHQVQLQAQQKQTDELQAWLNLNSRNPSKSPPSDGLNKPKSLRKTGERPADAPKGHKGDTLRTVNELDHVFTHAPLEHCDYCLSRLGAGVAATLETRQVFDLPSLSHEVTEPCVLQTRCTCDKLHRGQFPAAVAASVPFGLRLLAAVVHLHQHHMVPLKRCASLMGELFGLPMSDATILSANAQAATALAPTVNAIKQALLTQSTPCMLTRLGCA